MHAICKTVAPVHNVDCGETCPFGYDFLEFRERAEARFGIDFVWQGLREPVLFIEAEQASVTLPGHLRVVHGVFNELRVDVAPEVSKGGLARDVEKLGQTIECVRFTR